MGDKSLRWIGQLDAVARFRRHLGQQESARALYERSWTERNAIVGKTHRDTIAAQCNYGNQLREMRDFKKAEEVLSNCLETAKKHLGPSHTYTLICMNNYGLLQKNQGNMKK